MAIAIAQPRWSNIQRAAAYAGVGAGTLRSWIRSGLLPGYRVGPRRIQVNLNDLDAIRQPVGRPGNGT